MIHEEAVKAALAGGPRDAHLARHLEECPDCRVELQSLRALEEDLRAAAGPLHRDVAWEARLESRLARSGQSGRSWTAVAASFLLASALVLSWTVTFPGKRTPGEMAALPVVAHTTRAFAPATGAEQAPALWMGDEDSTAQLLQLADPLADELRQSPPDALKNYLSPDDSGGWNG